MTAVEQLQGVMYDPDWHYVLLRQDALDRLATELGREQVGPYLGYLAHVAQKPLLADQDGDPQGVWHLVIPPGWTTTRIEAYLQGLSQQMEPMIGMVPAGFVLRARPSGDLFDVCVIVVPSRRADAHRQSP